MKNNKCTLEYGKITENDLEYGEKTENHENENETR
ncbi:hypothetical protein T4D_14713 [Trichinella pseudospiralis]|uniref:Uncharacterized protein n=1 Tax=Trichinella pseudospiralis TaxID=6337 RepID=A0A0V1DML6_TRIPS|nr:hypothetical protein T4D_14713 [Trichinella pseudospiralis]